MCIDNVIINVIVLYINKTLLNLFCSVYPQMSFQGMLSKVLPLRRAQAAQEQQKYDSLPPAERAAYALPLQPLKLIIMSATMRVNDFQNPRLFPTALPPIIKVIHFVFP